MAKKSFHWCPLGDRIVVLPSEKEGEKKLASGIIIPEMVDYQRDSSGEGRKGGQLRSARATIRKGREARAASR